MHLLGSDARRAAVLVAAVLMAASLPARVQRSDDTLTKGKAACRALRDAGIMSGGQSTPEGTVVHQLGAGWASKHPGQQPPAIQGVYGVGGFVSEPSSESKTQWWLGVFPSLADATADMEDHRLWPPKLERQSVDSDYDEAYTSTDTSMGTLSSESGGDWSMPGLPYVEGRFRCGRLVVYLLWQRTPRSPQPPGDGRVTWARREFPTMRREGRAYVVEMARGLHQRLIRERACWCTSKTPEAKPDLRIGLQLQNVIRSVHQGSPITGVALLSLRGIAEETQVTVSGALVQKGAATCEKEITLNVTADGARKLALTKDLGLYADGGVKPGPAEVVVSAAVGGSGERRWTSRRVPIQVLPTVRKVAIEAGSVSESVRAGERARVVLTYGLTNLTAAPLKVAVTDSIAISGPRDYSFAPTSRTVTLAPHGSHTVQSGYVVTFERWGSYQVHYRIDSPLARSRSGRLSLSVTEVPTVGGTTGTSGNRKTTEPPPDEAAARSKHSASRFLLMSGKAAEAETALREVVRLDPAKDAYWETLYLACVQQQKWPQAEEAIRKAVTLKPDKWEHRNNLAIVLDEMGKRSEAVVEAKAALRLGMPRDAFIVRKLGITP